MIEQNYLSATGFRVTGRSAEEIELSAYTALAMYQPEFLNGKQNAVDLKRILDDIAFCNYGYSTLLIDDNEMPKGIDAFLDQEQRIIVIKNSDYDDIDNPCRARQNIAHEVAHIVLGHDREYCIGKVARFLPRPLYEDSEWQADSWASSFLMPLPLVVKEITKQSATIDLESHLSNHFLVSKKNAQVRLSKFKRYARKGKLDHLLELFLNRGILSEEEEKMFIAFTNQ